MYTEKHQGGERAREYMQETFFVYNQNTLNYSHKIHCHEEENSRHTEQCHY